MDWTIFLMLIQQGRPDVYSAFSDSTYNAQYLQCIWLYYISLIPGVGITDDQKTCNSRIKPCRQAIEWSYGNIENIFQICSHPRNYRLGKRLPYATATEQLRVCHLLYNIYTWLNRNKASSHQKFDLPSLENYLVP